jgi:hypothetical protein
LIIRIFHGISLFLIPSISRLAPALTWSHAIVAKTTEPHYMRGQNPTE